MTERERERYGCTEEQSLFVKPYKGAVKCRPPTLLSLKAVSAEKH
jgi:hypothetical protein